MKPDAIHPGKTYESRRPWGTVERRIVLEVGPGFPTYGGDNAEFGVVVRYRQGDAPGNTKRLRGREYVCSLKTFAGWARREVRAKEAPRG